MLGNIFKWLENVWNLRKIFDKYLPQIRELVETVKKLQQQIVELKAMKEELENGIFLLKSTSAKEDQQDTEEIKPSLGYDEKLTVKWSSKTDEWYDSEGNGGWNTIINPDKK